MVEAESTMRIRTRRRRGVPIWPSSHPIPPPGSLLGDPMVLVMLAPSIPEAVPGQRLSGEFIFLLDTTFLEHAQVSLQSRDQDGVEEQVEVERARAGIYGGTEM